MQRREPPRRGTRAVRRRSNTKARLVLLALAAALLSISIYLLYAVTVIGIGPQKYYNVTVNGISLKGYTRAAAQKLFQSLEEDWKSREYTLTYADRSWSFSASTFDASLDIDTQLELAWNLGHYGSLNSRMKVIRALREEPRSFTSELTYDEGKLNAFLAEIQSVTDSPAVDAEVVIDVNAPRIVTESRDGSALDVERTRAAILSLLLTGQGETALTVNVVTPAVSSEEVSGGFEIIASYATDLSSSGSNRRTNVELALRSFYGLAVNPGEVISFNQIVGERTEARGYMEAPEYDGTTVVNGIGGGSCQASTTLYVAAMMAGMDIIERHPHNMTVAYADPSLDATVSWPRKDFVFQNNTGHTVYIYTGVTGKQAWVVIYGNRPEYKIDFTSVVTKKTIPATREEIREDVTGRYAYYVDDKYLYSKGKDGCESQGWLIFYDWETGEEVERKQVSNDSYAPGTNIYMVGVHSRQPVITPNPGADY